MVLRRRLCLGGRALVPITTSVMDGQPMFYDKQLAEACLSEFREAIFHYKAFLVGYVLMPSHLHALIGFSEIECLSRFMQRFKSNSAVAVKNALMKRGTILPGVEFQLWQKRFDDLIITSKEQFIIKLNYIHNNSVKNGLVSEAVQWENSSAADWISKMEGKLRIDKNFSWIK